MPVTVGDVVRTATGEVGRVVRIEELDVDVAFPVRGEEDRVVPYMEDQLCRVSPRQDDRNYRLPSWG